MKRPVILRRSARAEFDAAADWYEKRSPGRGPDFTAAVRQALDLIAEEPLRFAVVHGEVREADVRRYPHVIYYRPDSDVIHVLAVFHPARDPAVWQARADG